MSNTLVVFEGKTRETELAKILLHFNSIPFIELQARKEDEDRSQLEAVNTWLSDKEGYPCRVFIYQDGEKTGNFSPNASVKILERGSAIYQLEQAQVISREYSERLKRYIELVSAFTAYGKKGWEDIGASKEEISQLIATL